MTRWMVLIEKQSADGNTKARWCIAGARKHDTNYAEATCRIRGDRFGETRNGGPVAFIAQAIIIWECNDDVKLTAETRTIIEKWANGDFVIDASGA